MGLFDFMKKKAPVSNKKPQVAIAETNSFGELYDRLTPEGELPFGWVTRNKMFCQRINREYSHFLNLWLESRNKSPLEQYSALKSFVQYLEDVEKLCKSNGECFEFWFREILTGTGYVETRKKELEELTANFDKMQTNYDRRNDQLCNLDNRIIKILINNPGILQADFVKMFDPLIQSDVREKLYFMEKAGKLERIKSGRSYILHYKK